MRRILLVLLVFLGIDEVAWGQFAPLVVPSSEEASAYFLTQRYAQAALLYKAAVARDTTNWQSTYQLAESLRHLLRYSEAIEYYRRVYKHASRSYPAAEFYYALLLKQAGYCSKALPLLTHFINTQPNHILTKKASVAQQGCYQAALLATEASSTALNRLPAPFNTPAHDYAAVPYQHDSSLVLASGRWRGSHRRLDARYGENYTDLVWIAAYDRRVKNRSRTIGRWNSDYHDGPGCFNATATAFFFTRCETDNCRLYVSEYKKEKWQRPTPLNASINAQASNSKHPALTPGGDSLFFASDRPGGAGGFDLWLSVRDSTTSWQPAVPLGERINSPGDEIAPFYDTTDDLFVFASSGRSGPGGMDLYGVPRWKESKSSPQLLLSPFNSAQDDCFLALGNRRGYLSSNRTGDFDIYQFTLDTTQSLVTQLLGNSGRLPQISAGLPNESTSGVLQNYDIKVPVSSNDIVVVHSVPEQRLSNGSSRFVLASDVSEIALSELKNQQRRAASPAVAERAPVATRADQMKPLVTVFTDSISQDQRGEMRGALIREMATRKEVVPNARIHLLDSMGSIAKITTTNETGQFHFVNLNPTTHYILVMGDSIDASDSTLRLQDLRLTGYSEANTTAAYETLYFDFNESSLRPEARQALRELSQFLVTNTKAVAEINAFADSLGNDAYNLQLSRQRANVVFNFLVAQRIDPSALVLNAEGMSTAWSSTNSLVSQQLNRRVEIRLIGQNLRYTPQAETRILRPDVSLESLYRTLGIDLPELERLNGTPIDTLPPLKPLRIPLTRRTELGQFFFDKNQQR